MPVIRALLELHRVVLFLVPPPTAPLTAAVQNCSSQTVIFSLFTRALYNKGEDLSSCLVITKGLCVMPAYRHTRGNITRRN